MIEEEGRKVMCEAVEKICGKESCDKGKRRKSLMTQIVAALVAGKDIDTM